MHHLRILAFGLSLVAGLLMGGPTPARAGLILVTSRAALGGDDMLDWTQFGELTEVSSPTSFTTTGGATGSVSQLRGKGQIVVQGTSALVNFATGDGAYWTQNFNGFSNLGPVSLTFGSPVKGVGTQIASNAYGAFTAFVSAYDANNNLLGTYYEDGVSNDKRDNSAIFIGVLSDSFDISRVVFGLSAAPFIGSTADFMFNQVSLVTGVNAVPEPSSFAIAGIGMGSLALLAYARRRPVA